MSGLRVSVALCTWNGERFLREQLDSLLAQTRLPDEIVVRDDVSGDGTWSILQGFVQQAGAKGVVVDLQRNAENLGYVRNFSAALSACNGDIVFLCDQDDVWHADKIARMCAEFEHRSQLGVLHTDARLVDAAGKDTGVGLFESLEVQAWEIAAEHAGDGFDVLLRRNTATGAAMALRREYLQRLLPVPEGWVHDEWLAIGVSVQAQVDCMEWASIDYRQHGGNQIGARKRTLQEKLAGSGASKREFMAFVAARLERALLRLQEAGLSPPEAKLAQTRERIAHARFRERLPESAWRRIPHVLAEARSGRYREYSSGLRSIISDFLDWN